MSSDEDDELVGEGGDDNVSLPRGRHIDDFEAFVTISAACLMECDCYRVRLC
jgi:hypothetical protein